MNDLKHILIFYDRDRDNKKEMCRKIKIEAIHCLRRGKKKGEKKT